MTLSLLHSSFTQLNSSSSFNPVLIEGDSISMFAAPNITPQKQHGKFIHEQIVTEHMSFMIWKVTDNHKSMGNSVYYARAKIGQQIYAWSDSIKAQEVKFYSLL